jgi:hypothetical protein
MKRLALYDGLIALAALFVWIALVVVEVEVRELWFFRYIFWTSLLLLFIAFPAASLVALRDRPEIRGIVTALSVLCVAPAFIVVGVVLVSCFKIMIGGHIS